MVTRLSEVNMSKVGGLQGTLDFSSGQLGLNPAELGLCGLAVSILFNIWEIDEFQALSTAAQHPGSLAIQMLVLHTGPCLTSEPGLPLFLVSLVFSV